MSRIVLGVLLPAFLSLAPLAAQDDSPTMFHHSAYMGGGMAQPRGDLKPLMDTKFALRMGYGFRPVKYFQVDAGFESTFHAANVDIRQETFIGQIKKTDSEFFIPFGGRGILPLAHGWLELYGGGGGTYMQYREDASVEDSDASVRCRDCRSRSGWGVYAVAGVNVALERTHRFFISTGTRWIRGKTNGDSLGAVPAGRTMDRWIVTTLDFMARF